MKKLASVLCVFVMFVTGQVHASPVDGAWYRSGPVHVEGILYAGPSGIAITDSTGNISTTTVVTSGAAVVGTTLAVTGAATFSSTVATGNLSASGTAAATSTIAAGTYFITGVSAAVEAVGTSKTDCVALTREHNVVTAGSSLMGVCLVAAAGGIHQDVKNSTSVSIIVYPLDSGNDTLTVAPLAALATDAGWTIGPGGSLSCIADSSTNWSCVQTLGVTASVGAASSGQGGTALAAVNLGSHVMGTGADDTKSITLPTGANLGCIRIYNQVANKVLPILGHNSDNDTINGGSADGAQNMGPGTSVMFCTIDGVAWQGY